MTLRRLRCFRSVLVVLQLIAGLGAVSANGLGEPLEEKDIARFLELRHQKELTRDTIIPFMQRAFENREERPETFRMFLHFFNAGLMAKAFVGLDGVLDRRLSLNDVATESALCQMLAASIDSSKLAVLPRLVFQCASLPWHKGKPELLAPLCSAMSDDPETKLMSGCKQTGQTSNSYGSLSPREQRIIAHLRASFASPRSAEERSMLLKARALTPLTGAYKGWIVESLVVNHAQALPFEKLAEIEFGALQLSKVDLEKTAWLKLVRESALKKISPLTPPQEMALWVWDQMRKETPSGQQVEVDSDSFYGQAVIPFTQVNTAKTVHFTFKREFKEEPSAQHPELAELEYFMDRSGSESVLKAVMTTVFEGKRTRTLWTGVDSFVGDKAVGWRHSTAKMSGPAWPALTLETLGGGASAVKLELQGYGAWASTIANAGLSLMHATKAYPQRPGNRFEPPFDVVLAAPRYDKTQGEWHSRVAFSGSSLSVTYDIPSLCMGAPRCGFTLSFPSDDQAAEIRRSMDENAARQSATDDEKKGVPNAADLEDFVSTASFNRNFFRSFEAFRNDGVLVP